MQRLRENDAIELRALYPDGGAEIGHHRRSWIGVVEIDDLGARHARSAEALGEIAFLNLEDGTRDHR